MAMLLQPCVTSKDHCGWSTAETHFNKSTHQSWVEHLLRLNPGMFCGDVPSQKSRILWICCADVCSLLQQSNLQRCCSVEQFTTRDQTLCIHVSQTPSHGSTQVDVSWLSIVEYFVSTQQCDHVVVYSSYSSDVVSPRRNQSTSKLVQLAPDVDSVLLHRLPAAQQHSRLCDLNVIEQTFNICACPAVQAAWQTGQELHVQGLVYDFTTGLLTRLVGPISSVAPPLRSAASSTGSLWTSHGSSHSLSSTSTAAPVPCAVDAANHMMFLGSVAHEAPHHPHSHHTHLGSPHSHTHAAFPHQHHTTTLSSLAPSVAVSSGLVGSPGAAFASLLPPEAAAAVALSAAGPVLAAHPHPGHAAVAIQRHASALSTAGSALDGTPPWAASEAAVVVSSAAMPMLPQDAMPAVTHAELSSLVTAVSCGAAVPALPLLSSGQYRLQQAAAGCLPSLSSLSVACLPSTGLPAAGLLSSSALTSALSSTGGALSPGSICTAIGGGSGILSAAPTGPPPVQLLDCGSRPDGSRHLVEVRPLGHIPLGTHHVLLAASGNKQGKPLKVVKALLGYVVTQEAADKYHFLQKPDGQLVLLRKSSRGSRGGKNRGRKGKGLLDGQAEGQHDGGVEWEGRGESAERAPGWAEELLEQEREEEEEEAASVEVASLILQSKHVLAAAAASSAMNEGANELLPICEGGEQEDAEMLTQAAQALLTEKSELMRALAQKEEQIRFLQERLEFKEAECEEWRHTCGVEDRSEWAADSEAGVLSTA